MDEMNERNEEVNEEVHEKMNKVNIKIMNGGMHEKRMKQMKK